MTCETLGMRFVRRPLSILPHVTFICWAAAIATLRAKSAGRFADRRANADWRSACIGRPIDVLP